MFPLSFSFPAHVADVPWLGPCGPGWDPELRGGGFSFLLVVVDRDVKGGGGLFTRPFHQLHHHHILLLPFQCLQYWFLASLGKVLEVGETHTTRL